MTHLTHQDREKLNKRWLRPLLGYGLSAVQREAAFAYAMDEVILEYEKFLKIPQEQRYGENILFFYEWINYTYAFNDPDLRRRYAERLGLPLFSEPEAKPRQTFSRQPTI